MESIQYVEPLKRAYERMIQQLFRPFDLGVWISIGFGCWLARLTTGGGFGQSYNLSNTGSRFDDASAASLWELPAEFDWHGLTSVFAGLAGCAVLFILFALVVILPIVLWLSSRGQFIFLDNVVHGRSEVQRPWSEFAREGNSLFLWLIGFVLVAVPSVLALGLPGGALIFSHSERGGPLFLLGIALAVGGVLAGAVVAAYVGFFLIAYVVPIMHRERIRTTEAWRVFLPVIKERPGSFLLVGLFYFVLQIATGLALVFAGIMTCCIGLLVLAIPFVGTVITLPFWVTFRLFHLEFLAQFSPRFHFLEPAEAAAAPITPSVV